MAKLEEAAKAAGVFAIAVSTNLNNLAARKERFAGIALLNNHHYVVFTPKGDRVQIIDPPKSYSLPSDTFDHLWTGKALLLGSQAFQPEESIRSQHLALKPWGILAGLVISSIAIGLTIYGRIRSRYSGRPSTAAYLIVIYPALIMHASGCAPASVESVHKTAGDKMGAVIKLTPPSHDLGLIDRTEGNGFVSIETIISNTGDDTLKLYSITPSCSCTVASLGEDHVGPGKSTTLTSRIRLGDSSRPQSSSLAITCSDFKNPVVQLLFKWQAKNALRTIPEVVEWPRINPGQEVSAKLHVLMSKSIACDDCNLFCNTGTPLISCDIIQRDAGPDQTAVEYNSGQERFMGLIDLRTRGGDEAGVFANNMLIKVICKGKEMGRIDAPIQWIVRPDIEVAPSRLWLGARKPRERVSYKILLSSDKPFRIMNLSCDEEPFLSESKHSLGSAANHTIDLVLNLPAGQGPWRSQIRIAVAGEDDKVLTLPVSAVIE
jgi:hypothetical protein